MIVGSWGYDSASDMALTSMISRWPEPMIVDSLRSLSPLLVTLSKVLGTFMSTIRTKRTWRDDLIFDEKIRIILIGDNLSKCADNATAWNTFQAL